MTTRITTAEGLTVIVDDEDADLAQFAWRTFTSGNKKYVYRRVKSGERYVTELIHRVILGRKLGRALLRSEKTDHIHSDTLDNRRSELRLATGAQNSQNRGGNPLGVSGLKGVSYSKKKPCWYANIHVDGKGIRLGSFTNPLDAHKIYCIAALKYHREFANFGANSPFTKEELAGIELSKPPRLPRNAEIVQPSPEAFLSPRHNPQRYSNLIIETQKRLRGWKSPPVVKQRDAA